jgi:hypothetical protein
MKPEAKLSLEWDMLMNRLPNMDGHESIENTSNTGTPDKAFTISGINGWAELKVAKEPKKDSTCIKLPHWSKIQRLWMKRRLTSSTVFLVLRVGIWDYILDTHNMFNIENIPYGDLKKHIWKVQIGEHYFWNAANLLLFSNKLRGQDILKTEINENEY